MPASRATAADMFPLVETYLNRDLTQKAFCQAHGLSEGKLNYWLAKYRQQTSQPSSAFIELTPQAPPTERVVFEVVFPDGVQLRFFTQVEPAYLTRLLTGHARSA